MSRPFVVLPLLMLSGLLTGCALPGTVAAPTAFPANYIPTVIHLTAEALNASTHAAQPATPEPTRAPTQAVTFVAPTFAPTLTPTPGPRIPLAAIQIRAPGPMSRIVSPLQVQMLVIAGSSHRVDVDLFGEDGRLLGHSLQVMAGSPLGDPLSLKMRFEIRAAGENGYVQVSTKGPGGRLQSLVTVPILLLSSGASEINPAGNTIYERVAFSDLPPESEASGAVVEVKGQFLPYDRQPFYIDLVTDDGRLLSSRQINATGGDWQSFETTLPFKVATATPARLYVHQEADVPSGSIYIYSQAITLNP